MLFKLKCSKKIWEGFPRVDIPYGGEISYIGFQKLLKDMDPVSISEEGKPLLI